MCAAGSASPATSACSAAVARNGVAPMFVSAIRASATAAVLAPHERRHADRRPVLRAPRELEVRPARRRRAWGSRISVSTSPGPSGCLEPPRKNSRRGHRPLAVGPDDHELCVRARASPPAGRRRGRRGRASRRSCRGGAPAGRRSAPPCARRSGSAPARSGFVADRLVAGQRADREPVARVADVREVVDAGRCRRAATGRAKRSFSSGISEWPPASSFASSREPSSSTACSADSATS